MIKCRKENHTYIFLIILFLGLNATKNRVLFLVVTVEANDDGIQFDHIPLL